MRNSRLNNHQTFMTLLVLVTELWNTIPSVFECCTHIMFFFQLLTLSKVPSSASLKRLTNKYKVLCPFLSFTQNSILPGFFFRESWWYILKMRTFLAFELCFWFLFSLNKQLKMLLPLKNALVFKDLLGFTSAWFSPIKNYIIFSFTLCLHSSSSLLKTASKK